MKPHRLAFALTLALFVHTAALAGDAATDAQAPSLVTRAHDALVRGADAAARGIKKGAKAAEHGVRVGIEAAARGIERGAQATARAAQSVAKKVERAPAAGTGSGT